jgi:hypothetical protein
MSLVKIKSGVAVAPEQVVSVVAIYETYHPVVRVSLSTGESHDVEPDYRKSVWDKHDQILKLLEPKD